MATKAGSSDFLNNLGRVYGMYTGGFLAFVILIAVLEQMGVPNRILGYLFVFFTISVYAIIGVMSRTAQVSEYYFAGRSVPAFYNGMSTGAAVRTFNVLLAEDRAVAAALIAVD